MKFLALDYGQKRTGVAITDPAASMVFPRCTIHMQGKDHFFGVLLPMLEEEKVEAVVVGLPLRSDGSDSETTRQVRNMVARLQRRVSLPVYFMEETLSSFVAEEQLKALKKKNKSNKDLVDQVAAIAILESFLALPPHKQQLLLA